MRRAILEEDRRMLQMWITRKIKKNSSSTSIFTIALVSLIVIVFLIFIPLFI